MNDEHVLNGAFDGIRFRPDKHRKLSAAPTADPTVVHVHLNKHHVRDLAHVTTHAYYHC